MKFKSKNLLLLALVAFSLPVSNMLPVSDNDQATRVSAADKDELTDEDLAVIIEVYNSIKGDYIEDIDKSLIIEGALKGMVDATGDQFSEYYNVAESDAFEDDLSDSFEGIGVQFSLQDDQVVVISPIDGTPAAEVGIQANDIILEADGEVLTGKSTNEIVSLIRGKKGTKVKLKIQREGASFEVEVTRDTIPVESVKGNLDEANPSIGKIQITQFAEKTYDELVKIVQDLRDQGAERFVFDLRANPGGLLDQALLISNMFVQDGDVMMQAQERDKEPQKFLADTVTYGDFKITEPYVVLINEGSASASEILAGNIQQNTDFPLIGTTTFGKGTVQTITNQSEYGELRLTIAKWLTPDGTWIHEAGIAPDIEVLAEPVKSAFFVSAEETLERDQTSDQVANLAVILTALGYELDSDVYFDEAMELAVKTFQTDHDLEADGKVTGETAKAINQAVKEYIENNDSQYDKAIEVLKGL